MDESGREERPVSLYPCEHYGGPVPADFAFAPMETLEVLLRHARRARYPRAR